jgi:hypothetical protein
MAYFISLNEDKTQIVVSQEWSEGSINIGPDGYLIGNIIEETLGYYGAGTDEELVELATTSFAAEVTTATEAVAFFKANVGPVFFEGAEL